MIQYYVEQHHIGIVIQRMSTRFSSKHALRPLQIGGMNIPPAENVKSLGVTLDSCLTLKNMSVPFEVLLLCTSETLERFVIF